MPTADIIEYDLAILAEMTQKELTIQQIARQDLFMPKREHRLLAKQFANEIEQTVVKIIDDLKKLKLDAFAEQVQSLYDDRISEMEVKF